MEKLLLLLVLFPLVIGIGLLLVDVKKSIRVAFVSSLVVLVISFVLAFSFNNDTNTILAVNYSWISSLGISFSLALDGISLLLVLLTTFITPFIIAASFGDEKPSSFYGLILLMQSALLGVFLARDGFLFYLFWEMALVPIWFICLLWGGERAGKITLKFFIYTLTGSLFMLVAFIYLYLHTSGQHSFAIEALYRAGQSLPPTEQGIIFLAMFFAFAIKMPVFPFHTWQPDTYVVSPVQGTMLLSAIMLKMGIYGVIRWLIPMVPLGTEQWGFTAMILSVIGILYASCIAIVQNDIKRMIAYSSIAHVGLMAAGLFTLTASAMEGAMIQMLSHGIIVFALFYIVEIIFDRTKTREFSGLGGIRQSAPIFTSVFIITMLGSVALPLTSGFVGEFILITSLVEYQFALGAIAGISIILGPAYMLYAFRKAMLGQPSSATNQFKDLTLKEKLVLFPMVVMIIGLGIFPMPILKVSKIAVENLLQVLPDITASVK
jgi:NADH-quinone oxidoreductase subunit M